MGHPLVVGDDAKATLLYVCRHSTDTFQGFIIAAHLRGYKSEAVRQRSLVQFDPMSLLPAGKRRSAHVKRTIFVVALN